VGLLTVALLILGPPPNTLCVWVVVAPNGEGPEPVLFENADCMFTLLLNGKGVVLLPNAVGVVEVLNGEGATEMVENTDSTVWLCWLSKPLEFELDRHVPVVCRHQLIPPCLFLPSSDPSLGGFPPGSSEVVPDPLQRAPCFGSTGFQMSMKSSCYQTLKVLWCYCRKEKT